MVVADIGAVDSKLDSCPVVSGDGAVAVSDAVLPIDIGCGGTAAAADGVWEPVSGDHLRRCC